MRLINTTTLEQREFFDSHCWSENEISLAQYQTASDRTGSDFRKFTRCCRIARSQGLDWAWIDTCCIDKTSSAELSEAINSMFKWCQRAVVCYVFLEDYESANVQDQQDCNGAEPKSDSDLSQCRWFKRGWTLQELVASQNALFYDTNGVQFGTKASLVEQLASITGIETSYLNGESPLRKASVACRMSWASRRITTRSEDVAYCLLGLFDVNMPLLYGEGEQKAFTRLQEAIITKIDDESVFAWKAVKNTGPRGLLADHPKEYATCGDIIVDRTLRVKLPAPRLSSRGVEWYRPRITDEIVVRPLAWIRWRSRWNQKYLLVLLCRSKSQERIPICVLLTRKTFDTPMYRLKPTSLQYGRKGNPFIRRLMSYTTPFEIALEKITISRPAIGDEGVKEAADLFTDARKRALISFISLLPSILLLALAATFNCFNPDNLMPTCAFSVLAFHVLPHSVSVPRSFWLYVIFSLVFSLVAHYVIT